MKLNSTTAYGFEIKCMAGYGPSAWNVGSAPVTISLRERRNGKSAVRFQREARTGNGEPHVAVTVTDSVARRCVRTESRAWGIALDLVVGFVLVAFPLMMGL